MTPHEILWLIFAGFVVITTILDFGVFNRKSHTIHVKEAVKLSLFWIFTALIFNFIVYLMLGYEPAIKFLTGYLIEKSLSIDNLFVFLIIFSYFKVDSIYQHKVLFWGIGGAMVMRAAFIFAGIALIEKFHWTIYIFGAFLIFTGIKMVLDKDKEIDPGRNPVLKTLRRFIPITGNYHGGSFFIKTAGKYIATPLFIVIVVMETTDIVFAVDSIPAILGITTDPFIVYTSNIFAILGLRALFFALAGVMKMFSYLSYGLAVILAFIGVKMLIADFYKIPIGAALGVVAGIILISIIVSVLMPVKKQGGA